MQTAVCPFISWVKRRCRGVGKAYHFLERLADHAQLETEPLPAQPIVEIAGECRVLVENHRGVRAYSSQKILIGVNFGQVCVCGCNLKLTRMTKEQLVIRGQIESVSLDRRKGP